MNILQSNYIFKIFGFSPFMRSSCTPVVSGDYQLSQQLCEPSSIHFISESIKFIHIKYTLCLKVSQFFSDLWDSFVLKSVCL